MQIGGTVLAAGNYCIIQLLVHASRNRNERGFLVEIWFHAIVIYQYVLLETLSSSIMESIVMPAYMC